MTPLPFEGRLVFALLYFAGACASVFAALLLRPDGHLWAAVLFGLFSIVSSLGGLAGLRGYRSTVWAKQRWIMRISGQELPESPTLNKTSLLYLALVLEEAAELFGEVRSTQDRARQFPATPGSPARACPLELMPVLAEAAHKNRELALRIREVLARTEDFDTVLYQFEARGVLDGITDLMVVVAGFTSAAGLPGEEAYDEVHRSNLSKAQPSTGLIAKDPSGKWIKGPEYTPPDLDSVLAPVMDRRNT